MHVPSVLIVVANGSESLETVTIANVLRRGGLNVTLAALGNSLQLSLTRGLSLTADALFETVQHQVFDAIVLPGGEEGANAFANHAGLLTLLRAQRLSHRWIAAICASPALVLSAKGLLDGKQATGYPAMREQLLHYVDRPVVIDGHTLTGQGPAQAIAFALALVEQLAGEPVQKQVAADLLA